MSGKTTVLVGHAGWEIWNEKWQDIGDALKMRIMFLSRVIQHMT